MHPGPLPRCRWIVITEAGLEGRLFTTSYVYRTSTFTNPPRPDFGNRGTFALGGLKTRGTDRAVGGVLAWEWGDNSETIPTRAEARFRKYRGATALDFGAGLVRKTLPYTFTGQAAHGKGVTLAGGFDHRFIGADARIDLMRGNGKMMAGGFVGARATSLAAPAVTLAAGAAIMILIVAAFGGSD